MRQRSFIRGLARPLLLAAAVAQLAWLAPIEVQAQNSREATEAVRRHRAETGTDRRTTTPPPSSARTTAPRSAGAGWERELAHCLDPNNPDRSTREACIWRHCEGRWGQGQCPPGRQFLTTAGANSRTPLGRCLTEAGKNPFRRDGCGWRICKGKAETSAECAAFYADRQ